MHTRVLINKYPKVPDGDRDFQGFHIDLFYVDNLQRTKVTKLER